MTADGKQCVYHTKLETCSDDNRRSVRAQKENDDYTVPKFLYGYTICHSLTGSC